MRSSTFSHALFRSTAIHGAAVLGVFVTTLLQSCASRPPATTVFTFVDVNAGNPAPPAPPVPPAPDVRPPDAPDDDIPDVAAPRRPPKKIVISTNLVRRAVVADQPPRPMPPKPVSVADIKNSLAGVSQVAPVGGPVGGGGGPGIYDPYLASVKQAMYAAWVQPGGLSASAGLVVKVDIRVLRDGTLVKKSIARRSGNPTMDESVQRALDSVDRLRPLPSDWRGSQRDIGIAFELTGAML